MRLHSWAFRTLRLQLHLLAFLSHLNIWFLLQSFAYLFLSSDTDSAMFCRFMICLGLVHCCTSGQMAQQTMAMILIEMVRVCSCLLSWSQTQLNSDLYPHKTKAKHERIGLLHSAMTFFNSGTALIGNHGDSHNFGSKIDIKTNGAAQALSS